MEKIGSKETTALFVLLILSRVCLGGINGFVSNSGTAASINVLIGIIISLSVCLLVCKVFSKEDFGNVFKKTYGRTFGIAVLTILFFVTVLNASMSVRNFTQAIGKYVLPNTPDVMIAAVFSFCIVAVSRFGIESVTRYSLAVFFVFVVLFAIILCFSHTEVQIRNIIPFRGKGGFGNVFDMVYVFSDIIYMFLIIRGINKNGAKAPFYALATGGIITAVLVLFYTLCVPYPVSERFSYPLYRLASLANTTVVFQRLDGIVYIIWMFSGFISVGTLGYFAAYLFESAFGISDKRAIVPMIALLVYFISGISIAEYASFLMSIYAFGILPVTALLYKFRVDPVRRKITES